jgi:hypothetical protein
MSYSEFRRVWLDEPDELDRLTGAAPLGGVILPPPHGDRETTGDATSAAYLAQDRDSKNAGAAEAQDAGEDRSSTFSFPPPTVPGPLFSSVAPMALEADESERAGEPRGRRRRVLAALTAAALVSAATIAVLGSYGALTLRSSSAWGSGWKAGAAPAAAMTPLTDREQQISNQGSRPDPVDFATVLPAQSPAPAVATEPASIKPVQTRSERAAQRSALIAGNRTPLALSAEKQAAAAALDSILKDASTRCREEGMSQLSARVTAVFSADGIVRDVSVDVPSRASSIGGCLAVQARRARIGSYDGDPVSVTRMVPVR